MLRCTDNWICSLPFNKNTFCLSWYWAPDRGEETEWPNPIKPYMNPFDWLQLVRLDLKILQNDIKDTKFSIATCATYLWIHFAICLSENPSCLAPSKCSYETSAAYKGTNAHSFQLLFWKKKKKQSYLLPDPYKANFQPVWKEIVSGWVNRNFELPPVKTILLGKWLNPLTPRSNL